MNGPGSTYTGPYEYGDLFLFGWWLILITKQRSVDYVSKGNMSQQKVAPRCRGVDDGIMGLWDYRARHVELAV